MSCKHCKNFEHCMKEADTLGLMFDPNYDGEYHCVRFVAKTNADYIRSLNDIELSKWLFRWFCKNTAAFLEKGGMGCMNAAELKDWLQQPAEEDSQEE